MDKPRWLTTWLICVVAVNVTNELWATCHNGWAIAGCIVCPLIAVLIENHRSRLQNKQ